jgi:hypothetical protein
LKVLNVGSDNGQFMMQGRRSNPKVVITHGYAARTQLPRHLACTPGDVSVYGQDGVSAQTKPAVLLFASIKSFRKLARADDADIKRRVWVLD